MAEKTCSHTNQIVDGVKPSGASCDKCVAAGTRPVQLRMCLTCGHVGCCDSTPGKHATAHFKDTGHALMRSIEPGATWGWCYVDERMLDLK